MFYILTVEEISMKGNRLFPASMQAVTKAKANFIIKYNQFAVSNQNINCFRLNYLQLSEKFYLFAVDSGNSQFVFFQLANERLN